MPKVSIIIPNYNYKQYLPQRIDSVLHQTFDDYEIILQDDCSTDGSKEYLQDISRHPKVSVCILNEKNTGNPFVQWQKGIQYAKGEYIWIAESDDYCEPSFLEEMVSLMDSHPNASYAFCGSHIVDENNQSIKKNFDTWKQEDGKAFLYHSQDFLEHYLLWRCTSYNASMVLFRKSKYENIQMNFSALRYSGDWLFWIKMAEQGDVIILHKRLNYFRRHSASVTNQANGGEKQLRERIKIYTYLLKTHHFGAYRNTLAKGCLYKDVKRAKIDDNTKNDLLCQIAPLGGNKKTYTIERIIKTLHSLIPYIPTPRYDPFKGKRIK